MKIQNIILVVIMFLAGNGLFLQAQAPLFELRDLNNKLVSYDDIKGEKLTVLDFWATWCQPCLRSIPELNEMYNEYKMKGVNVVGISIDGPRSQSKLKPFVSSIGIDYTVLKDINSEVMSDLNVTAVPTLLIFNSGGELLYLHEGYRPGDKDLIRESIEKHL